MGLDIGMKHVGSWFSFSKGLSRSNSAELIHRQTELAEPCALHLVYILQHLILAQFSTDSLLQGAAMAQFAQAGS